MSWLSRVANVFRTRRIDSDIDDELRFHVETRIDDLMRDGVTRERAIAEAARRLGGRLQAREASRDIKLLPWLESVWQDLRYAARSLRRSPTFTAGATIALVIAIGLNSSFFTLFNAVALRPWAVHDPARVFTLFDVMPREARGRGTKGFSLTEYRYLRDHARAVSGLVAWRQGGVRLGHEAAGTQTLLQYVSGNFFDVLGVNIALGRSFRQDEDRIGSPQAVAVLRHSFWLRQFGADPGILGRAIRLDDVPFTVVGVAAPEFTGTAPEQYELWIPLAAVPLLKPQGTWASDLLSKPTHCCSAVAGRLADGTTRAGAQAELEALHRQFARDWSSETKGLHLGGTAYMSQSNDHRDELAGLVFAMFSAVTLVLVLACANVGNLMLARAMARQREIGIRLSIGASRLRVVRQLLTEGLLLAAIAGGLGLAAAAVLPSVLLQAAMGELPSMRLTPDLTVVAYTTMISVAACLLFGLAPALKGTRPGARLGGAALNRPPVHRWRHVSLRGALLATQLAVSVVLLVSALLLVRGVRRAGAIDPGFKVDALSIVSISLPANAYDQPGMQALCARMVAAMRETSGLWPAGLTANVPLSSTRSAGRTRPLGEPEATAPVVEYQEVSAGYFQLLNIPIVDGRVFADEDAHRPVVLVNQSLARLWWPGRSAVGRVLVADRPREVIGVVKDTNLTHLDRAEPMYYVPFSGGLSPHLVVRRLDPASVTRLAAIASALDRRIALQVRPLTWFLDRRLAPLRVGASLASGVGLLALCLATIGVFGVFAYMVEERTREIGIRVAIGAERRQVIALVLRSSALSILTGLASGVVLSLFATRIIQGYLHGVSRFDGLAYAGVAGALAAAAVAATSMPVRRALRIDPLVALREE